MFPLGVSYVFGYVRYVSLYHLHPFHRVVAVCNRASGVSGWSFPERERFVTLARGSSLRMRVAAAGYVARASTA